MGGREVKPKVLVVLLTELFFDKRNAKKGTKQEHVDCLSFLLMPGVSLRVIRISYDPACPSRWIRFCGKE
jgi:hypothetical protein